MDIHTSRLYLSGRTDRVNQLAHISLVDGKSNTSVGLNVEYVRGTNNTVVGAYAGVLDAVSRGVVFVGESAGRKAQRAVDSVAIGSGAMSAAHTTQSSVFIGTDTGRDARRATYCTAVGHASGSKLGTALRTTLIGSLAGQFAVNTVDDTFVGYGSGGRCRDGARNACLGAFSAHKLESGSENVLIGYSAGANIGTAHQVVGIGPYALENANNSSNVIAIGSGAGRFAANAENSLFVGTEAGTSSDGGFNVYVGPLAGNAGSFNTMVGYGTGGEAQGNNNTYLGYGTGHIANGDDNTLLGHITGNTLIGSKNVLVGSGARVDGNFNVCVGYESGDMVSMVSNSTFIGAGSGCDGDGNAILGKNAGLQGIGSNNALIGFQTAQYLVGNNNVIAGVGSANNLKAQNSVIVGPTLFVHDPNSKSINLLNSVAIGSGITSSNSLILGNAVILGQVAVSDLDSGAFVVGSGGSRILFANANSIQMGLTGSRYMFVGGELTFIGLLAGVGASGIQNTYIGHTAASQAVGSQNTVLGYGAATSMRGDFNVILGQCAQNANCSYSVIMGLVLNNSFNKIMKVRQSIWIGFSYESQREDLNLLHATILGQVSVTSLDSGSFIVGALGRRLIFANSAMFQVGASSQQTLLATQNVLQVGTDANPVVSVSDDAVAIGKSPQLVLGSDDPLTLLDGLGNDTGTYTSIDLYTTSVNSPSNISTTKVITLTLSEERNAYNVVQYNVPEFANITSTNLVPFYIQWDYLASGGADGFCMQIFANDLTSMGTSVARPLVATVQNTQITSWSGFTPSNSPSITSLGGYNNGPFVRLTRSLSQYFDGGNKTFNIATGGGFTVVALVKFRGTAGLYERIIDFGTQTTFVNNIVFCREGTNSTLNLAFWNSSGNFQTGIVAGGAIVQDEWAVFTGRYTASGATMQLYKNNVQIGGTLTSVPVITNRSVPNTYVGRSVAAVDAYSNVDIGCIMVYDRSLSPTEMTTAYQFCINDGGSIPATPVVLLQASTALAVTQSLYGYRFGNDIYGNQANFLYGFADGSGTYATTAATPQQDPTPWFRFSLRFDGLTTFTYSILNTVNNRVLLSGTQQDPNAAIRMGTCLNKTSLRFVGATGATASTQQISNLIIGAGPNIPARPAAPFVGVGGPRISQGGYNGRKKISFDRLSRKVFQGPEYQFPIGTRGFTALTLIKFTGVPGNGEHVFDFANFVQQTVFEGVNDLARSASSIYLKRVGVSSQLLFGCGPYTLASPNALVQDEWIVIAVRHAPNASMQILKNNVIIAQQTIGGTTDILLNNLILGGQCNPPAPPLSYVDWSPTWQLHDALSADIGCFMVFDRSLSDIEMTEAYNYCIADAGRLPRTATFLLQASAEIELSNSLIFADDKRIQIGMQFAEQTSMVDSVCIGTNIAQTFAGSDNVVLATNSVPDFKGNSSTVVGSSINFASFENSVVIGSDLTSRLDLSIQSLNSTDDTIDNTIIIGTNITLPIPRLLNTSIILGSNYNVENEVLNNTFIVGIYQRILTATNRKVSFGDTSQPNSPFGVYFDASMFYGTKANLFRAPVFKVEAGGFYPGNEDHGPGGAVFGSSTQPSFCFNSFDATGLYRPDVGVLAITCDGTECARFNPVGLSAKSLKKSSWTSADANKLVTIDSEGSLQAIPSTVTASGLMHTSKTSITTGFTGGPRIKQTPWDAPGPTHSISISVLMDSCDNVSGMLYLHTSSKANDNKNGMATLGIIKSFGYGPAVTVFTSQKSANLGTFGFSIDVQNENLIVSTDAGCAICWTFMSGV